MTELTSNIQDIRQRPRREQGVWLTLEPLQRYLSDPDVWELRINKYQQVVCETSKGRISHDDEKITAEYISRLTDTLCGYNGLPKESVNNVLLPDGSRGIICLPPAVLEGTVAIAFRKHLPVDKSLEQLRDEGRFTGWKRKVQGEVALQPFEQELLELLDKDDLVSFFKIAVRNKLNIVVSGSTGSGKSTFTRSLLREVPYTERIVVSEDVHEIGSDLHHEMVYMLYGDQDGRLAPAVSLKACMRLSPDRIMMTELRDDAAWDYINSLNTGHPGGITSTHADDAKSTFSRIALLIKQTGVGQTLDYDVIMKTLYTTIDVVVYMEHRQIVEVLYDPAFKKAQLSL